MKLVPILTAALMICAAPALAQDLPLSGAVNQLADKGAEKGGECEGPKNPISDAQRLKLHALRDQFILDTAQTKAQLKVSESQLRDALSATTIDKSAAMGLQTKIDGLRSTLCDAKLKLKLAMNDVFTPEQREEMRSCRRHHHGRWGRGHECGPGRGCPEEGPRGHRAFGPGPVPPMAFGFVPGPMMGAGPDLVFEPGLDFDGAPTMVMPEMGPEAPGI